MFLNISLLKMDFGSLTEMDNFIQNEKAKIYTMDNITRCPQCNLIPSLNFSYVEKNQLYIMNVKINIKVIFQ